MKNRLPRKRKKQVKKVVARKTASKMAMCAVVAAQSYAQTAIISAIPVYSFAAVGVADKALRVIETVINTAYSVKQIMSEPPNSWREFIK